MTVLYRENGFPQGRGRLLGGGYIAYLRTIIYIM
jgi:hypothetical protein